MSADNTSTEKLNDDALDQISGGTPGYYTGGSPVNKKLFWQYECVSCRGEFEGPKTSSCIYCGSQRLTFRGWREE